MTDSVQEHEGLNGPAQVLARIAQVLEENPENGLDAIREAFEAERERRAKIISARGELEASSELKEASDILSQSPASLQLRYLQTLLELGADQNSTVVFPLPMDVIGPLVGALKGESK